MTLTSHEARKSMTVVGPIWTCHKCEEPWPCETELLGQRVEKALLLLDGAEVLDDGEHTTLTESGYDDIFGDDGAFGALEQALYGGRPRNCSHLIVTADHSTPGDGDRTYRWTCRSCGAFFVPTTATDIPGGGQR